MELKDAIFKLSKAVHELSNAIVLYCDRTPESVTDLPTVVARPDKIDTPAPPIISEPVIQDPPTITVDDVRLELMNYLEKFGEEKTVEVLKQFGATKISEIENLAAFHQHLKMEVAT